MGKVKFDIKNEAIAQLGENLYKHIYGVIVEYITNSYDADASQVKIKVDRNNGEIIIEDDGIGMSKEEVKKFFLAVGENRRKRDNKPKTKKGRRTTGRKGLGKLAFFGLFKEFIMKTHKDGNCTTLSVKTGIQEDYSYEASLLSKSESRNSPSGTIIYLRKNTKKIPPNDEAIAERIAKRINLMYEGTKTDPNGFTIYLNSIKIDKSYRDDKVLNEGVRFVLSIPADLKEFNLPVKDYDYIIKNNISGVLIARKLTVRIKENKGITLFARGKLCQEATYLDSNPSNDFSLAHLYGELDISYIDNFEKENIGTDRTALKETEETKKLYGAIQRLINGYVRIYNKVVTNEKNRKEDKIKKSPLYVNTQDAVEKITDEKSKRLFTQFLKMAVTDAVKRETEDISSNLLNDLIRAIIFLVPTKILYLGDVNTAVDRKDNILAAYDKLMQKLKDKYDQQDLNDGNSLIDKIYPRRGNQRLLYSTTEKFNLLNSESIQSTKNSIHELGKSIVSMRNAIDHTNDRTCLDREIPFDDVKRFLAMIDLFLAIDDLCFVKKEQ